MHSRAKLLSLEQRRRMQLLSIMFIHKQRHNVAHIYVRRTKAAERFAFVRERYNCTKYKNSPYYKGALLWDVLPETVRNSNTLLEFKNRLRPLYRYYNADIS